MLPRTSIVLLLLMIVPELPLTVCRHPTLCLHHLFHFIRAILETLGGVEALNVAAGLHPRAVEVADGVVTLGHWAHSARICSRSEIDVIQPPVWVSYHIQGRGAPSSWASNPSGEQSTTSRS